jgi:hypothetical protein
VLQVPAARCACLLALVACLGAFFNPKRLNQIELCVTAIISFADMGSDIFSISVNYRDGNIGLASALLATVLLSMSVQILIVVVVHRHHGKRRLMLEILFVITGVNFSRDDFDARQPPQKPGAGRAGPGCHPRPHWPWQGATSTVTTVVTLDGELPSQL